jgi:predicted nucleotidyltransferase
MKELDIVKKLTIDEVEKAGFRVLNIILFGSRARGDYKRDSDWDLLVLVDKDIQPRQRRQITGELYRILARFENSYEIIIKSHSNFEKMKSFIGSVSYEADREGIVI